MENARANTEVSPPAVCDVSLEVPPADQLKYFLLLALAHFLPFIFDDGGGKLADIRYWASTSVFPR